MADDPEARRVEQLKKRMTADAERDRQQRLHQFDRPAAERQHRFEAIEKATAERSAAEATLASAQASHAGLERENDQLQQEVAQLGDRIDTFEQLAERAEQFKQAERDD